MEWKNVIEFWFTKTTPKQWYTKDPVFDELVRTQFLETYNKVVGGETKEWRNHPEGRLAEIIVLDQFARNMFRDTPQAFSHDHLALALAEEAIRAGDDQKLPSNYRAFLYMPYMHSEDTQVHEKAIRLFESLGGDSVSFERAHKEIIDRFGRYPHRNSILGRDSTLEEREFMRTHTGF